MQHFKFSFLAATVCGAIALAACGGGGGGNIGGTPDAGILLIDAGPDAPPSLSECDTTAQDCPLATQKCTVGINAAGDWLTACRDIKPDPVGLNMACMRDSEGNAGVGRDNCDKGLYCTALGNPDGTFGIGHQTCRAFCRATSACADGFECMGLTDLTPTDGICIDSCDPLGAGCDEAATPPAWCQPKDNILGVSRGICVQAGGLQVDAICSGAGITDTCAANLLCVGNDDNGFTCRPICSLADATFPCATGSCEMINGFATDFGTCGAATAAPTKKWVAGHKPELLSDN
jgi:hypothetical protein